MNVPLLDIKAQNGELKEEFTDVLHRLIGSGQFILGAEVESFEQEVASLVGTDFAVGMSSGTDALLAALMALEIGAGDEVICPSFTFFATGGCISRTGAIPVFADSCNFCFQMDPAGLDELVTKRTKAIVVAPLFGQAMRMGEVLAFAEDRGLRVIEDAAQTMGSALEGRSAGTSGDIGTYSFFPTKNLGCLGDGGMAVTNDPELAHALRKLRNHGMEPKYHHQLIGGNFRIDALQAAFLRLKLKKFQGYVEGRQANARYYQKALGSLNQVWLPEISRAGLCCEGDLDATVPDQSRIILPAVPDGEQSIWNQFTLRILGKGKRDALRAFLGEAGIGCEVYYPRPLHQQECFSHLPERSLPRCTQLAKEVISLPIYPELMEIQLQQVAASIGDWLQGNG